MGAERWRYDRPGGARRTKYPIDALQGVLMGHNHLVGEMDVGQSIYETQGMEMIG